MYTVKSTLLLGILLVTSTWLSFKFFKKIKIKINEKFFISLIPWIFLAAIIRVMEDSKILPNHFLTTTPGIEILFVTLVCLAYYVASKYNKTKIVTFVPILISIFLLPFLNFKNYYGVTLIFILSSIFLGALGIINKIFKIGFLNFWAIFAHLFDASSTYISITKFGYLEQHVLPRFLIESLGPASFFILKIAVLIPILFIINKYSDDKELKNYLIIVIAVLGFAPAFRDTLRLFCLV